jgi:Uncharacterized conserved protein (COG2071)
MRVPVLQGVIDRRILLNYRVHPDVAARVLPEPFRPQLVRGVAMAGVCLIRLAGVRLRGLPARVGLTSENAAHRFAVEWDEGGAARHGVYIPRRDTSSWLNELVGGRLFPGEHHGARFHVVEGDDHFHVGVASEDGEVRVEVDARRAERLPAGSVFRSIEEASRFFEAGSVGCSDTRRAGEFDAIELHCPGFRVAPLHGERASSSFFEDHRRFPAGSVELDSALLMQGLAHEWHARPSVRVEPSARSPRTPVDP